MRDFIKLFIQEKTKIVPIITGKNIKLATVKSLPPNTDKEYPNSETFFDFAGNKTEYKSYQAGKVVVWEKFNYDKDGKLSEVLEGKTGRGGDRYHEKNFQFVPKTLIISRNEEIEEIDEIDEID